MEQVGAAGAPDTVSNYFNGPFLVLIHLHLQTRNQFIQRREHQNGSGVWELGINGGGAGLLVEVPFCGIKITRAPHASLIPLSPLVPNLIQYSNVGKSNYQCIYNWIATFLIVPQ